MTTSLYMPAVVAEVAFDSGYTTADADRTWTDVSEYVELHHGVGNTFGRQDELSTADANRLTLTLDNSDGRFTAGRAASPYYPNVKIGRPIRLRLNWLKTGTAGTFETDAGTWSGANASVARSTAQAHNGAASLAVTATAAANMSAQSGSSTAEYVAVQPSTEYVAEAWVRAATASRLCDVRIDWYTAAGASISTAAGDDVADSTSAWSRLTVSGTSPVNAAFARVRVLVFSPAASEVHYVDDVSLAPSAGAVRFVGFVDQWPVEWDGTDAYAKATVTAGSRLSRLGLGNKLRSMIEAEIGSYNPAAYWTMGDPADSAAAQDSAGRNAARVVGSGAPIVFGNATGPGTDGITAAQFAGSSSWAMGINPVVFDGEYLKAESFESDDVTGIRATALVSGLPGSGAHAYVIDGGSQAFDFSGVANLDSPAIAIDELGRACIRGLTGPSINDGATHDLLCVVTPGVQAELFVDGVSAGVGSVIGPTAPTEYRIGQGFNGVISHAAVYAGATLTSTQAAVQADVVLTGAAGDTTDERLVRILGWAGVAAAEIDAATGSETMTYQQTSGQSVVDVLREVESTEGGVLFDGRDGRVTFHNRSHRYTAPVAVTLDMAEQQVEADYAPKLDRSTLTNDVTVDNPTTGESARAVDTASADEYGTVTSGAKSVADSYDPLQQKASWLVASYAEPRPRVPSMTVDLLAQVGGTPSAEDILALTIGSRVAVVNQPAQADATDADYFVEGYSESIGPESYSITFNLSPAHPSLSAFMIEDATRGELDSSYVLAL